MDKLPYKQNGEKQSTTKTHTSYDKEALKSFSDSELSELHTFLKTEGNRNSRRLVESEMKRRRKN